MEIKMPEVDSDRDPRPIFAHARKISGGEAVTQGASAPQRFVAIVTPARLIMPIPTPPASSVTPDMLADLRQIVPAHPPQQITVIAYSNVIAEHALSAGEANQLIPFLGYLMGLAFDGHSVVVLEGHPSALAAGCEGATMLLVDEAMVEHLQPDWIAVASAAMQTPNILIFGRDGSVKAVESPGS